MKTQATINAGAPYTVEIHGLDKDGNDLGIKVGVFDPVSVAVEFTDNGDGTATMTVTDPNTLDFAVSGAAEGFSGSCAITVNQGPPPPPVITDVAIHVYDADHKQIDVPAATVEAGTPPAEEPSVTGQRAARHSEGV